MFTTALALPLSLLACQKDIITEFPDGLEPLEDTLAVSAPTDESANSTSGTDDDYSWAHLAGTVNGELSDAKACLEVTEVMVDRRSVSEWDRTEASDPAYDFSIEIWNFVEDILDVEFTNAWRHSIVEDPTYTEVLAARWQKIEGSDFLPLLTGSILILPVDDGVLEVQIIEHLDALIDPEETALQTVEDYYADIRACVHGEDLPSY